MVVCIVAIGTIRFNSNLVLLKVRPVPHQPELYSAFQFQLGSIKSFEDGSLAQPACASFQFQLGSIKSSIPKHSSMGREMFRFQLGSIKRQHIVVTGPYMTIAVIRELMPR